MPTAAAESGRYAAADIGGSTTRVMVARVLPNKIEIEHFNRFETIVERHIDGVHSNVTAMVGTILDLLRDGSIDPLTSIGFDTWSGDYALLRNGLLTAEPFNQRDGRTSITRPSTQATLSSERIFSSSGTRDLPGLTLHQLVADNRAGRLSTADSVLLLPDLLAYLFSGVAVTERTNASTTGLVSWKTGTWDLSLLKDAEIRPELFSPLVDAGLILGPVRSSLGLGAGLTGDTMVTTVASHDTASAIVALPVDNPNFAYVSCGSWTLVGVEIESPVLTEQARELGFTNEKGLDGTVRFLHISPGLWILGECFRAWGLRVDQSEALAILERAATLTTPPVLIDTTDPIYFSFGDMPGRIAMDLRARGHDHEPDRPEIIRVVIESLASIHADKVRLAAELSGTQVQVIHLVGGGSRNALLCQLTSNYSGLPVVAGPIEATATGNILVQARAHQRQNESLESLRAKVRSSFTTRRYEPAF
jgi:rhamnulokinase